MSAELAFGALTLLVGTGVSILTAAIPWAFSVQGRLSRIETSLTQNLDAAKRIEQIELRLLWIEAIREGNSE
ncbi:hypothetical protein ACYFX5_15445 [Bremerella sp. T1]|uniref:hypothetical protein n=1 Tax=Bremerella sp. TYQ1 TaxID=3119568 RepID=UPI001CCB907B|nr:hypothetical protein [Bremerella volcania]UBM34451.1 hypothetical protein LA756_17395 [Bremerella volcania]